MRPPTSAIDPCKLGVSMCTRGTAFSAWARVSVAVMPAGAGTVPPGEATPCSAPGAGGAPGPLGVVCAGASVCVCDGGGTVGFG